MRTLGIILAGGSSTRLYPSTLPVTKQLLPIYDKPLIYYPLSTLMLAGIRDIVVIIAEREMENFFRVLEPQLQFGINILFLYQDEPRGCADAFNVINDNWSEIEERFLTEDDSFNKIALIFGDNVFHGATLSGMLRLANKSTFLEFFVQRTKEPERFGVIFLDGDGNHELIVEKPSKELIEDQKPHSKPHVVTGLYFYPMDVLERVKNILPSPRGEIEITDLNNDYLLDENEQVRNMININVLKRGISWFDTGTSDAMLDAAHYVKAIQESQGMLIGSPHEVAFHNGWVSKEWLEDFAKYTLKGKSKYAEYLLDLIED